MSDILGTSAGATTGTTEMSAVDARTRGMARAGTEKTVEGMNTGRSVIARTRSGRLPRVTRIARARPATRLDLWGSSTRQSRTAGR